MKHRILLLVGSLTAGLFNVRAQTAAPAAGPSYSLTATATAVSQYMFRGQRLGGFSFQPAVELGAGDGVLGVWTNFPVSSKVPDTSDPEIDLYGSYNVAVSETVSIVPGFTVYWFPDAPTSLGFYRRTIEPSLAVNWTVAGVKLTPKLYYDLNLEGPTYELTAGYAVPLAGLGTELNFTATAGTYLLRDFVQNSSPRTKAWGDYWLVGVSVPYQISSAGKVVVGFAYTEGRDAFVKQGQTPKGANGLAVGRGVLSLSYSHSF